MDLANMMLILALRTSPEMVCQEALGLFSPEEIAEAFAATRGITVPSQLRAEIRKDSRDLVGAFRTLASARAPIRIQRWSVRRLAATVGVLLGAAIARITCLGHPHHRRTEVSTPAAPGRSSIAWHPATVATRHDPLAA